MDFQLIKGLSEIMSWQYLVLLVFFWSFLTTLHKVGGRHSGFLCGTLSKCVRFFSIPYCGCVCRISTLIMVPINFCEIFDLFKTKRAQFRSSKIDRVRAFQRKSMKMFKENLSNTNHKSLKYFRSLWCRASNWIILGTVGNEMTYLVQSVIYQCFRAHGRE